MVFLLNGERVFVELVNLSRMHLATKVGCGVKDIKVQFVMDDGNCVPIYSILGTVADHHTPEAIETMKADCYSKYIVGMLSERVEGLNYTWDYYDKRYNEKDKTNASEVA